MSSVRPTFVCALVLCAPSCFWAADPSVAPFRAEVQRYLDGYGPRYQRLVQAAREARWESETRIVPGDDGPRERVRRAQEELAAFTGSTENIELARAYLKRQKELLPVQVKALQAILFEAGGTPQTARTLVRQRIAAETAQVAALYGFEYQLDGRRTTTTEIDAILATERDLGRRLAAWEASKAVGPALRDGLVTLRAVRNEVVRALGHRDFFHFMVSEYGGSPKELAQELETALRELRPLYAELHTWARHALAARHGAPVPNLIPAHWLPDRWGQDWSALVDDGDRGLDAALSERSPRWLVEQGERFVVSLGFEPLPATFWERSSLLPVPPDAGFTKNDHASSWHVDLERDVRCLMSVAPDAAWFETVHFELGHVVHFLACAQPAVPHVLRRGAARAFPAAFGSLLGFAALQPRALAAAGVVPASAAPPDPMRSLLREALRYVVFLPWSAGVMFQWERALYADELPPEQWNERWWKLVERHQGIAPPSPRDERWCDPATKTHVNVEPATYYDHALSIVLLFQLHDFVARQVLREDPHDTCWFGREDAGEFLRSMMRPGATADWRELLRDKTGSPLSVRPMVDYFEPLRAWLVEQNRGHRATLPEPERAPKEER